jgi:nicotinamide-nucleotide amidase
VSAPARVALLSIGDELINGRSTDTNSGWLSRELVELGLSPVEHMTLDDGVERIAEGLRRIASKAEVVITTGGLGPTLDDVTREAAAHAAGVPLVEDPKAFSDLRELFRSMDREMADSNLRQVRFPAGARVLPNPNGTAPGFHMQLGEAQLFVLPGPPREMGPMFRASVVPALAELGLTGVPLERARFYLFAMSESVFAQQVHEAGDWMARGADPLLAVTADRGTLSVQLTALDRTDASKRRLEERTAAFRALFGESIYSEEEPRPAHALGAELLSRNISVTFAESCTGGGIAAALTDVPGISAVFERSWVTYADAAKQSELGVARELLERHGAVSEEVVLAMAAGAAQRAGARLSLSVSGIAGPGGGSEEKPVGLVWFGISCDGQLTAHRRRFPSRNREQVRAWATRTGLMLLLVAARSLPS